ncbi:MAG: sugar phosphate isomerase/epimerase family protein [Acetanaerobacterium sp.]
MILSTSTNICAFRPDGEKNSLAFCIEQCAKAGYTVLDINLCEAMNPSSRLRGDGWEQYVAEIAEIGRRFGVEFRQSHLPYYDIFGTADEAKVQLMEELIRRSILASGMLGVSWAVTHPGTVYTAGHNAHASHIKNLEYYRRHLETAKQAGVGIALENDFEYRSTPYQRIYAASVEELCELCDAFASTHIGICYDFGHAHLTGGFHRQNLNRIGKRLKAVHVQDNHGMKDEHLMPFFGTIDWADAMAGLAECGYEGELTYEIQEFARFVPNELKHGVVELSLVIGNRLLELFDQVKRQL